eukprot:jgi/Botrbrau1/7130/Bobra.0143s0010.1
MMFFEQLETLRTPSPVRGEDHISRKVTHSPWTAPRTKKKGRNVTTSQNTNHTADSFQQDAKLQRPVLMDVSNSPGELRFQPESSGIGSGGRYWGASHACNPMGTQASLQKAGNTIEVQHQDAEQRMTTISESAEDRPGSGRPQTESHRSRSSQEANTSTAGDGELLFQAGAAPDQKKQPRRRLLLRRRKQLSWQSSALGAAGEGPGGGAHHCKVPDGQRRTSPPTPWPGKQCAQGLGRLTDGDHKSCTPKDGPGASPANIKRGLSRFVPATIKAYFPAKESKRASTPPSSLDQPSGRKVQTAPNSSRGVPKSISPQVGETRSILHWARSLPPRRSSVDVAAAGSPMQESPEGPASATCVCAMVDSPPVGASDPFKMDVNLQPTVLPAPCPHHEHSEILSSPRSEAMSEVSVELGMPAPHAENSEVSLPAPLQFTRGPVSEDGSESFPTPRVFPLSSVLSPEMLDSQTGLIITRNPGPPLATIHRASAMPGFDHVYPTPAVLQGPIGEAREDSARAPMKSREAASSTMSRPRRVVDLTSFNERLQKAVEEDDIDAVEEAVEKVKEGEVLPDIDTLNNLLRCFCKIQGDPSEAADLVKATCRRGNLQPTPTTYHCLTEMWMRQDLMNSSAPM